MKALKLSIFSACLFLASLSLHAQNGMGYANAAFSRFNYEAAAERYKDIVDRDPSKVEAKERLADCYRLMNNTVDAEFWYGQLAALPNPKAEHVYYYAYFQKCNGKMDSAVMSYNNYLNMMPGDARAMENANSLNKLKALQEMNPAFQVNTTTINTKAAEYSPAYFNGGVAFVSNRGKAGVVRRTDNWTHKRFYDLYVAPSAGENVLGTPKKLKGCQPNRKFHESSATFTADFKEMYFTRSNYNGVATVKSADDIVKLKIMHASLNTTKNKWVNLGDLPFDNSEYNVAHPTLSKDGNKLFFVSDMPGGNGETDIYVSTKENGVWSAPVNLGTDINTAGMEMFPFIADDGTLYFASDGHLGLGGLDVFSASYSNGKWSKPTNLGAPINSNKDDFGYIMTADGKNGYFTSNRDGGMGDDDIYSFTRNPQQCIIATVVDAKTGASIEGAKVEMINQADQMSDANGVVKFCPVSPNKTYQLTGTKTGYRKGQVDANVPASGDAQVKLPLRKIENIDLTVEVTEAGKGLMSGAQIVLKDVKSGRTFPCTTGKEGACIYGLQPDREYEVTVTAASPNPKCSYGSVTRKVSTMGMKAPSTLTQNIELKLLCEEQIVEIPDIYYDLNKYNIRPDAAIQLDKVVQVMRDYPNMVIELRSHTDCRASLNYNMTLSQNRATAAVNYIVLKGIEKSRMIAKGYGPSIPKIVCDPCKTGCTEAQHQMNRRTEFKVVRLR